MLTLLFVIENVIWVIFALSLANEIRLPRLPKMWFVIPGVISVALFGFHDAFHITTSHEVLRTSLKRLCSRCTKLLDLLCSRFPHAAMN